MINQGIVCMNIVIRKEKFSKLVGFYAEEIIGLEGDNLCDGVPLFPLDKRLLHRLVLHEREDC